MQQSFPINATQSRLAQAAATRRNAAQDQLLMVYQTLLAQHEVTEGHVVDITDTAIVIEVPDEVPAEVPAAPAEGSKPQLVE
jgi:hypothetical protein